jgi:hypothetical protein
LTLLALFIGAARFCFVREAHDAEQLEQSCVHLCSVFSVVLPSLFSLSVIFLVSVPCPFPPACAGLFCGFAVLCRPLLLYLNRVKYQGKLKNVRKILLYPHKLPAARTISTARLS